MRPSNYLPKRLYHLYFPFTFVHSLLCIYQNPTVLHILCLKCIICKLTAIVAENNPEVKPWSSTPGRECGRIEESISGRKLWHSLSTNREITQCCQIIPFSVCKFRASLWLPSVLGFTPKMSSSSYSSKLCVVPTHQTSSHNHNHQLWIGIWVL